ncbi:MAG: hypothetical protein IKA78_02535, partial [Oscillospiraceae bacterium]|nr:hypothetical protein [Oscillospiraceae bacterium]
MLPLGVALCTWMFLCIRVFYLWRCSAIGKLDYQLNEEIRDKEVRVISDRGEQLGIMSAADAQRIANERDLDLV